MDIEAQATNTTRKGPDEHARQYAELGWEGLDHPHKEKLFLLYTKGRKSGQYRRTPLVFHFPDDESVVLVANNGGRPRHPDWYLDLDADPTVWIRYRDDFYEAAAMTVPTGEREDLWDKLTEYAPQLAESQANQERVIPLIRVTRKASA